MMSNFGLWLAQVIEIPQNHQRNVWKSSAPESDLFRKAWRKSFAAGRPAVLVRLAGRWFGAADVNADVP